jgi:hypothetical protein
VCVFSRSSGLKRVDREYENDEHEQHLFELGRQPLKRSAPSKPTKTRDPSVPGTLVAEKLFLYQRKQFSVFVARVGSDQKMPPVRSWSWHDVDKFVRCDIQDVLEYCSPVIQQVIRQCGTEG